MTEEVALFVDLENITSSLWIQYRQGVDPQAFIGKARKYGLISFARAYGDFSQQHMERLSNGLRVAGIEPFDCPVKVSGERTQSTVDMNIAIDLLEMSIDRPNVKTVVLMSGDRDFIRVVARLRHRLGKVVVIAGVPGTISRDLVAAADIEDPLEPLTSTLDHAAVLRLIDRYELSRHPGVLPIWSGLATYLRHPDNATTIDPRMVEGVLADMVDRGILRQAEETTPEGKAVRTTRLDRAHPEVQAAIGGAPAL
jgi:uncharacterized LabA/DUF88 family protein